jgi:hypothetical protein
MAEFFAEWMVRTVKQAVQQFYVAQCRHLHDRFYPAVSVFEDIWIDLSHANLADTMTKLNL